MFSPDELQRLLFVADNCTRVDLISWSDLVELIQKGSQAELDHHMETLDMLYWGLDRGKK
jgi:hypothetical protein